MDNGASSYRRFLDGDETGFDELIRDYREPLTLFIDRYVRDYTAAEDLAIDAFTYILVHPGKYNFKTSFKTYIYMIGRSRALDYIRRKRIILFEELDENSVSGINTFDTVLDTQKKKALLSAINSLPSNMRDAVFLVYFEDMSYEDAARVMNKTKKQVDNLIYRAKSALKISLKEEVELFL